MSFKLVYHRRGKNLQNEGDKLAYIEQVLGEIAQLENAVEKDLYLRQLSSEFAISLEALKMQEEELAGRRIINKPNKSINAPVKQYSVKKDLTICCRHIILPKEG